MTRTLVQCADTVFNLAYLHNSTWRDESEAYWLAGLLEEVGELTLALQGRHEHTPDLELCQIASIAINWLDMRAIKEAAND